MSVLGYVAVADVDLVARHVAGTLFATPTWPGWEDVQVCALVPVAVVDELRKIHTVAYTRAAPTGACIGCNYYWPCPTIRLIDGAP